MAEFEYKSSDSLLGEDYLESTPIIKGDLIKYRDHMADYWISAIDHKPDPIRKRTDESLRSKWRDKYTGYLSEISAQPQNENLEYLFFIKIIHHIVEDFNIRNEFTLNDSTVVHKKSLINFLRHAPDLYKYLSADSIFIDGDTNCVAVQIKRNHLKMNMHFKKDGGIVFNAFDDDQNDDSFRIFGDTLTSGKSYLKANKIKRILSILGD